MFVSGEGVKGLVVCYTGACWPLVKGNWHAVTHECGWWTPMRPSANSFICSVCTFLGYDGIWCTNSVSKMRAEQQRERHVFSNFIEELLFMANLQCLICAGITGRSNLIILTFHHSKKIQFF